MAILPGDLPLLQNTLHKCLAASHRSPHAKKNKEDDAPYNFKFI